MPDGFKAGSAYIEIDADADVAISKVERQLKASKGRLGRAADGVGKEMGAHIGTGLDKALDQELSSRLGAKSAKVGREIGTELGDGIDDGAGRALSKSPKTKKATEEVAGRTQAVFKAMAFAGAFGGLPIAAAGASAATVLEFAAIPLGLAAVAAKVQAENADVATSYTRLGDTATGVMKRASSVMVDDLVAGTDKLTASTRRLEPALTGAFRNSAPAVDGTVTALTTLADEALPGVITGTTKTGVAMEGLNTLSRSVGRGITDLFQNSARGAEDASRNMGTFGGIVQDAAGFLGTLMANLNGAASGTLPMFRGALTQVYGILTQVTGSGVAPLVSGVSAFITVTSGALGVIHAVTSGLGGWASPLAAAYGGFKALDLISGSKFGDKIGQQFDGLGGRIKAAEGARAKFSTGMSGLASAAFSPVGIAAGALTIGLGLLGVAHQKAAADAAAQKQREGDLAAVLRESNGAINDNVRSQAAKALQDLQVSNTGKNYLQVARELGVSQADLTSAYLGNATAGERVRNALKGMVDGSIEWVDNGTGATETMTAQGQTARDLMAAMTGVGSEFANASAKNKDLQDAARGTAASLDTMSPALAAAQQGAGKLTSAFAALYSPLVSAGDKANALITILDRLTGRTASYEESVQTTNDTLRGMADALAAGMDPAKGWGDALLNADGTVSTLTENGSNLQNQLVTIQSGFANTGASIQGLVESGMTYTDASAKVRGELSRQRESFVTVATAMLGSREAAEALADNYGLLPDEVVTKVTDYGSAVATQSDVDTLDAKLKGLPPNTPVRVTSLTAEAEQKLKDLNYTVTHMDDGTVIIYANPSNALAGAALVESRVQSLQDKTVYINVVATGVSQAAAAVAGIAGRAAAAVNHDGGYTKTQGNTHIRHRQTGGPTPVLAGMAGAAVYGETGVELGFPSRSEYVSTALQTSRMERGLTAGMELASQLPTQRTGSSSTDERSPIQITIQVYPTPSMDIDALTTKISRKIRQQLQGGS